MNNNFWTAEEVGILVKNYAKHGLTYVSALLPNRTKAAVARKATSLKLRVDAIKRHNRYVKKNSNHPWTQEELDIILQHKDTHTVTELLELIPNRTLLALRTFIARENIKVKREKQWSEQEIAMLLKYYENHGATECTKFISRTVASIQSKANLLGLKINDETMGRINAKKGRRRKESPGIALQPRTGRRQRAIEQGYTPKFKSDYHKKANEVLERHWKGEKFAKDSEEYRIGKTMGILNY